MNTVIISSKSSPEPDERTSFVQRLEPAANGGKPRSHGNSPGRLILETLAEAWPRALAKDEVAEKAGYEADGGGFNNALSRLRTLVLGPSWPRQ